MDELSRQLFGNRTVAVVYSSDPEEVKNLREAEQRLFQHRFSDLDYAEVVGAVNGATLNVVYSQGDDTILIEAQHSFYQEEKYRQLMVSGNVKIIENILFGVQRPPAPQGLATRVIARQVEMATRLGFDKIVLEASGGPGKEFNGYYTWPRLGFNMQIPDKSAELVREGFLNVMDTNQLMSLKGGAEWWRRNGRKGICEFLLTRNSPMRKVLDEYLSENGIVVFVD